MESIQSFSANVNEPKRKKPKKGIGTGLLAFNLTFLPAALFAESILLKGMKKFNNNLTADEVSFIDKAVEQAIEKKGMKQKGLEILKASSDNAEEIKKIFMQETELGIFKYMPKPIKKIKNIYINMLYNLVMDGENACYSNMQNKIIIPERGVRCALPHEAGHAMNTLLSRFGKILQKCRPIAWLTLPIGLIALLKNKKSEGEEPKNFIDKTTTFIKNNAGKLVMASWLPIIAEEGLASIRGYNSVKKLLTPNLAKRVMRTNILGFSSYVFTAAIFALGIHEASKSKDAVYSKNLAQINQQ